MQIRKSTIVTSLLVAAMMIVGAFPPSTAFAQETKPGLFVNLTTDDTWSAGKAIMFAHQKALKNGHKPVAIWLNVRAVYLADKKRPSHVHGLMRKQDKSIQDMLAAFIKDGGTVITCQACSQAAGLTKDITSKVFEWGTGSSSLHSCLTQRSSH